MTLSTYFAVTLISSLLVGGFAQLSPTFYGDTCPDVATIVHSVVENALQTDPRVTASLIRLHFHDCFVLGCEGSLLLDNSSTIITEKDAAPGNLNSVRRFDVVDQIKTAVERACPGRVSCADILALASESSVELSGGPSWEVPLGRRDGVTANRALASQRLPNAGMSLQQLIDNFAVQGLNRTDLVALSGAHTFGKARCFTFRGRLYNSTAGGPDPTLNTTLLPVLRRICPEGGNGSVITDLDQTTPETFDEAYFSNLRQLKGLLTSDQVLFSTGGVNSTTSIVNSFSANQAAFFRSFVTSMIKMGNIGVLTGTQGEIRANCRRVNSALTGLSNEGLVAEY